MQQPSVNLVLVMPVQEDQHLPEPPQPEPSQPESPQPELQEPEQVTSAGGTPPAVSLF